MLPQQIAETPQEDEQPWQQQHGENNRWYSRFYQYLTLGPTRSIREVYRLEKGLEQSRHPGATWIESARRFQWQERAKAYDDYQRRVIFASGNAADTERVKKLDALVEQLYARVKAMLEKAPPDETLNEKTVTMLLEALDLLAKHTGGYGPKRIEHTGKDGAPIEIHREDEQSMHVFFYMPRPDPIQEPSTIIEPIPEATTHENESA